MWTCQHRDAEYLHQDAGYQQPLSTNTSTCRQKDAKYRHRDVRYGRQPSTHTSNQLHRDLAYLHRDAGYQQTPPTRSKGLFITPGQHRHLTWLPFLPPSYVGRASRQYRTRENDKQSIKFKEKAIICCKEKKLLPRLMNGVTFHFECTKVNVKYLKM